jgi:hypothetical protein
MVTRKNFKSGGSSLASYGELLNETKSKVVTFLGHVLFARGMRGNISYKTSVK